MTMKHMPTPGPWEWDKFASGYYLVGPPPNGSSVRQNVGIKDVSIGQQSANAHLIAAAPEMLEALKAAIPHIDREIDNRNYSGKDKYWVELQGVSDNIQAAIAKAEGQ